ncbi:MAG: DUF4959 domain-containing protein [Prevotellaceae bacterium]|jgi:hypothetical protein|nr:DUF4959 domain-containing protein [Prevotellaceae bacterium]
MKTSITNKLGSFFFERTMRLAGLAGLIISISFMILSCTDAPIGQTPTDSTPPSDVKNLEVQSRPGGALLSYIVPAENDISYVKCEYMYNGEKHVVRSSVYNKSLVIEGLGTEEPLTFTVYVVDHSENASPGISKTFTPGPPQWKAIIESVELLPVPGGVSVTWLNETATEIGVAVFIEDSLGNFVEKSTRYSKNIEGMFSFRPFDTIEYRFGVRITDKWGNVSDMKIGSVTPLAEREFDKSKFFELALPGDNISVNNSRPLKNCWDGKTDVIWHTVEGQYMPFPMYITIDIGVLAQISRMKFRSRTDYFYSNHSWKTFEVWAASDYKRDMPEEYWTGEEWKTDGDWSLIADCEVKRPSGNPDAIAKPSGEDLAYAQSGFEFESQGDSSGERFRYLRVVIKSTWASGAMHMSEFYFYGWDL